MIQFAVSKDRHWQTTQVVVAARRNDANCSNQNVNSLQTSLGQTGAVAETISRARSMMYRSSNTGLYRRLNCCSWHISFCAATTTSVLVLFVLHSAAFSILCYPLTKLDVQTKPKGPARREKVAVRPSPQD